MANDRSALDSLTLHLRRSPLLRLVVLWVLMLFSLIPIGWISDLIGERMQRRNDAVAEVSSLWGKAQTFVGPALLVPYEHRWTERDVKGRPVPRSERHTLTVLPRELRLQARVDSEERWRGIFTVPVYRVALEVSGGFEAPDLAELRIDPALVEWHRSVLAIGVADARAIQRGASLTWNGEAAEFQPGADAFPVAGGIHAPVPRPFLAAHPRFSFALTVNGSGGLYFTPAGQETSVSVDSNWPSPSFQRGWLPVQRSVGADGFRATWKIPALARNQQPAWTSESGDMTPKLEAAVFGVDFVTPVDAHRMAERSVKYARLFVLMTFGLIWLIEVLARVRVHPIQYLLIGGALCTFYLLELSLSEHLGFAAAYLLASVAVVGLIGAYTAAILEGWRRAAAAAVTVGALYTYLYVLLTNEDYALLFGSLGVFIALAVTMRLTRQVDWYALRNAPAPGEASEAAPSAPA